MTERPNLLIRFGRPALIVLGLAALGLIAVNLDVFDQALDTDIGDAQPVAATVSPADDALRYMLGLTAASDQDPGQVGAARLEAVRGNGTTLEAASDEISTADLEADAIWLDRYPAVDCNSRSQLGCLDRLVQDLESRPIDGARLRLMLERYRTLRGLSGFDEGPLLHADRALVPDYGTVLRLARLSVAAALQEEGAEAALEELAAGRAFWEMMLREGDTMLARMVAVAGLWTQLQFVSELVATGALTPEELDRAAEIVRPLPAAAKDLGSAFATEQRTLAAALDDMRDRLPLARRVFIALTEQPNATLNRFNRQVTQPMVELSAAAPADFRQRVEQGPDHDKRQDKKQGLAPDFSHRVFPPGLYNLGGTMLLQPFRVYSPWDYIGRIHDLSGMLGLVRLQIEIEGVRVRRGEELSLDHDFVERIVEDSNERNQYTGDAMRWEGAERMLGFDCFGESICRVRIQVGF